MKIYIYKGRDFYNESLKLIDSVKLTCSVLYSAHRTCRFELNLNELAARSSQLMQKIC